MFDRGISQGDTPRLWIDVVAHVMMGRDKRIYRFVQDTRFGRTVIAESHEVAKIVEAVTDYVARRMIEREHALVVAPAPALRRMSLRFTDSRAGISIACHATFLLPFCWASVLRDRSLDAPARNICWKM